MQRVWMTVTTDDDEGNPVHATRVLEVDTTHTQDAIAEAPIGTSAKTLVDCMLSQDRPLSADKVREMRRIGSYVDKVINSESQDLPTAIDILKETWEEKALACLDPDTRAQFLAEAELDRIRKLFAIQYVLSSMSSGRISTEEGGMALAAFKNQIRREVLTSSC